MLGDRGYYEIKPSRDYEAVYNEVCDAISLYFGIIKAYEAEMTRLLNEDPDVIAESAGSTGHITLKNVAKRPKLHKKLKRTKLAQIFWLVSPAASWHLCVHDKFSDLPDVVRP